MIRNRVFASFEVKAVNNDQRIIEGVATSVLPDRLQDVVEPKGGSFRLPLPLLAGHDSSKPVGEVTRAVVSSTEIRITARIMSVDSPPSLRDRLDLAWAEIKSGLTKGLSIGFRPLQSEPIKGTGGIRFTAWELLEISLVTIPAHASAGITNFRSAYGRGNASSDQRALALMVRRLDPAVRRAEEAKLRREIAALDREIHERTAMQYFSSLE